MVLDRRKKGRLTQLFGQKNYLETAPGRFGMLLACLRVAGERCGGDTMADAGTAGNRFYRRLTASFATRLIAVP